MELAKITVSANRLTVTQLQKAVAGTVGATVSVTYDETWDAMDTKTLVWRAGSVTVDDMNASGVIPAEVLAKAGRELSVGVYGTKGDAVAIPTLWGSLGLIYSGADPSGDESADPTLPVWARMESRLSALEEKPMDPERVEGIVEAYLQENPAPAGPQGEKGEDYVLTEADKTEIAQMAAGLVELPGGTGGSASAKVFDFTFEDGAKLKITDLGNDIVNVYFLFVGNRTGAELMYELPADNAEFTAWADGKALMFQTIPIVNVGGINAGTFYDFPALAMLDVSGALYGAPAMMLSVTGYHSDSVESIMFNETVRILSLAEFG